MYKYNFTVTERRDGGFLVSQKNPGDLADLWAVVYRREAKRGPRWSVYLRNSTRMLSHHSAIWREVVEAVEAHLGD
jgi:hypothetical protein